MTITEVGNGCSIWWKFILPNFPSSHTSLHKMLLSILVSSTRWQPCFSLLPCILTAGVLIIHEWVLGFRSQLMQKLVLEETSRKRSVGLCFLIYKTELIAKVPSSSNLWFQSWLDTEPASTKTVGRGWWNKTFTKLDKHRQSIKVVKQGIRALSEGVPSISK